MKLLAMFLAAGTLSCAPEVTSDAKFMIRSKEEAAVQKGYYYAKYLFELDGYADVEVALRIETTAGKPSKLQLKDLSTSAAAHAVEEAVLSVDGDVYKGTTTGEYGGTYTVRLDDDYVCCGTIDFSPAVDASLTFVGTRSESLTETQWQALVGSPPSNASVAEDQAAQYYALLYLPGKTGKRSGTVGVGEFFSVGVKHINTNDLMTSANVSLPKKKDLEKKYSSKRIEAHDSNGQRVDGVLGFWERVGKNSSIFSNNSRNSRAVISQLFFLKGAENKGISKLVVFFGQTKVASVDIDVVATFNPKFSVSARPDSYRNKEGRTVERTSYALFLSEKPQGEQLMDYAMDLRHKGIEFATVDNDGTVMDYYNTKRPIPGTSFGTSTAGKANSEGKYTIRYYTAGGDYTCSAGQDDVFIKISDDDIILQGKCEY